MFKLCTLYYIMMLFTFSIQYNIIIPANLQDVYIDAQKKSGKRRVNKKKKKNGKRVRFENHVLSIIDINKHNRIHTIFIHIYV